MPSPKMTSRMRVVSAAAVAIILTVGCSDLPTGPVIDPAWSMNQDDCPECEDPTEEQELWMENALDYIRTLGRCSYDISANDYGIMDWGIYGENRTGEHYPESHGTQLYDRAISKVHDGFDGGPNGNMPEQERLAYLGRSMVHEYLHHAGGMSHSDIYNRAEFCSGYYGED